MFRCSNVPIFILIFLPHRCLSFGNRTRENKFNYFQIFLQLESIKCKKMIYRHSRKKNGLYVIQYAIIRNRFSRVLFLYWNLQAFLCFSFLFLSHSKDLWKKKPTIKINFNVAWGMILISTSKALSNIIKIIMSKNIANNNIFFLKIKKNSRFFFVIILEMCLTYIFLCIYIFIYMFIYHWL